LKHQKEAHMKPALVLILLSSVAWAQPMAPLLSVRRCDPSTTGFDPHELDVALKAAFQGAAASPAAPFGLAQDNEANVVVTCRGAKVGDRYHLTLSLDSVNPPALHDAVELDLPAPRLTELVAESVVSLTTLRARALITQQRLEAPAPAPIESAFEERLDEDAPVVPRGPRPFGRVGLSVQGGLNTPAGIIGAELELHACQYFSFSFAAGYGTWGGRVSPGVRIYPFGVRRLGLFVDGLISLSTGGVATVTHDGTQEKASLLFTPGGMVNLGFRQVLLGALEANVLLGFSSRFSANNVRSRDGVTTEGLVRALEPRQPQGLVAGASLGGSFF
jgi:hypothetical protein